MAPLLVHDKVIVGNSGGDLGVRGWMAALDAETGKEVWRAWSTGSDQDVKIGPGFSPYYDWMKGEDLGLKTWPPNQWKLGGGNGWGWVSYDPEANLVYYGTANPGVWNPDMRPGINLWSTAVFARDPDTGMAKWAYQFTPHDMWDYDGVNEMILADLPDAAGRRARCWCTSTATASATRSTAPRARCWSPRPSCTRTGRRAGTRRRRCRSATRPRRRTRARMTEDICPSLDRREGPAAGGVLAADGALLRALQRRLHELRGDGDGVHRRHALPGRGGEDVRPRLHAGRAHRLGRGHGEAGVDDRRAVPRLERRARHRRRPGLLRHDGRLVQGGGREDAARCSGRRTSPPGSSATPSPSAGRTATSTSPSTRAWAAGTARSFPGKISPKDPYAALGVVGAADALVDETHPGGAVHIFALQ